MTCGLCLVHTPALQEIGPDNRCPLCGADYSAWAHDYNSRTRKLVVKGDAFRDRLVAARLSLRGNQ